MKKSSSSLASKTRQECDLKQMEEGDVHGSNETVKATEEDVGVKPDKEICKRNSVEGRDRMNSTYSLKATSISNVSIFKTSPDNANSASKVMVLAQEFDKEDSFIGNDPTRSATTKSAKNMHRRLHITNHFDISKTAKLSSPLLTRAATMYPDEHKEINKRTYSLGKAVWIANSLLSFMAIVIVSGVLWQLLSGSKSNASYAAISLLEDVDNEISQLFFKADQIGITISQILFLLNIPLSDTLRSVRRMHLLFIDEQMPREIDTIFACSRLGLYIDVSKSKKGTSEQLEVSYINWNTYPNRYTYLVSRECPQVDNCLRSITTTAPLSIEAYNATRQNYFETGLVNNQNRWTHPHSINGDAVVSSYKSFSRIPSNIPEHVGGSHINLQTLCKKLYKSDKSIDSKYQPLSFIVDNSNFVLVVSSGVCTPSTSPVEDGRNRIEAVIENLKTQTTQTTRIVTANSKSILIATKILTRDPGIKWILVSTLQVEGGQTNQYAFIAVSASTVILVAIISFFATRHITKRLSLTAQSIEKLANFELNLQEDSDSNVHPQQKSRLKEIQCIESGVATLSATLKSFSKYVPLDVVTLLVKLKREAVLGVDQTELTIFFSDIADFTTIAEAIPPEDLVKIMSVYLDEMSKIIIQGSGIVDKYIGDAVMAFWNAPLFVENHPFVACKVALKCQRRLAELRRGKRKLNQEWQAQGLPEIRARIGMHSGNALVGNLGSPGRLNYTCLGDNVNLASRLEGLNKIYGTEIMISSSIYDVVKHAYVCRSLDFVAVKGRHAGIKVYELVESKKHVDNVLLSHVALYEAAFDCYRIGDFERSLSLFNEYLKLKPGDIPSIKHVEECSKHMKLGTKVEEWDPTVIVTTK